MTFWRSWGFLPANRKRPAGGHGVAHPGGDSLTDTVVVFDRIRENLAKRRGKLAEIINLSVNEVLSRTIITSSTVFLVVVALFFGGVVLGISPWP